MSPGTAGRGERLGRTVVETHRVVGSANVTLVAAAIAYYAFVSVVPLVVLGVAVATTVGGVSLADRLVLVAGDLLAPAGETLLREALARRTGLGGVTAVGLLLLVWGALKAFRALDRAFSLVYGTRRDGGLVHDVADALVALLAVGVAVGAMVAIGAGLALIPGPLVGLAGSALLLATLVVAFVPLYSLFPDVELTLREVLPGAAFAGVGWTILGAGFRLYATTVAGASVYGLLGAVMLALTWGYLGALVLLVGAAINAVRTGHGPGDDR